MSNRKANLYAVILIVLTACAKESTPPTSGTAEASSNNTLLWRNPFQNQLPDPGTGTGTTFGLMEANADNNETQTDMANGDVNLVREPIFLSEATSSKTIDDFLESGYNVQINANWYSAANGTRGFPTNIDQVKARAEDFFQYYAPYKNQIPFVAIENEWDYDAQHGGSIPDYLAELSAITDVAHKYGFKVSDGAITGTALRRWMYSQLSGDEQDEWKQDYYIGLNYDYDEIMDIVNTFIDGVQNINIDYLNVHWYNVTGCYYGFETATQTYLEACNKKLLVCNEFGIRTNSLNLFDQTVDEIKQGNPVYAIAYSGGNKDNSVQLTDAMLGDLH